MIEPVIGLRWTLIPSNRRYTRCQAEVKYGTKVIGVAEQIMDSDAPVEVRSRITRETAEAALQDAKAFIWEAFQGYTSIMHTLDRFEV